MPYDQFHVHLYGAVEDAAKLAGAAPPLPASFEEMMQRFDTAFPNAYSEPDGSIAWASKQHQIVGTIYDFAGQVQYVELRGRGGLEKVRTLVETLCGTTQIEALTVMVLPERQWKNFHDFEKTFPED